MPKKKTEKNRIKLEKDFWKDNLEMYQKYLKLSDEIEVQKMNHEIDLYDLDESKFNQGKEGLISIPNRQKERREENKQYIKDLFLFKAKEGENEVITVQANGKNHHEELKLVLNKDLYGKCLTYEKKVLRKKDQFEKADKLFYKSSMLTRFLEDRYP
ncbi:hypothetical protein V1387_18350 [Allomuricauda taeanensis]|uniref:hypothetical protein n=1 Tax=Flagellimonas taeanensis TaxID=1005926 RepID=UPI002E7AC956|nr:hypothetical protein [Allomuricauda taeanensis]MEE1964647.1 hypothetical protein [Allomuricauda taeanensis]